MSRGWESKSVESQQAEPFETTPVKSATNAQAGAVRNNSAGDAEQKRRRQALELQRERVLSERTASPHRRSALSAALLSIEEELTELGWVVHL